MDSRYTLYTGTEELHSLVRSMSQPEKLTYRLSVTLVKKKAPDYDLLYTILDSAEVFDKKKIEQQAKAKGIYKSPKQFAKLRSYLYHKLLGVLQESNATQVSDVRNLLEQAWLLIFRGFYPQALTLLDTAWPMAQGSESFNEMLSIIDARLWVISATLPPIAAKAASADLFAQHEQVTGQKENLEHWKQLRKQASANPEPGPPSDTSHIVLEYPCKSSKARIYKLSIQYKLLFRKGIVTDQMVSVLADLVQVGLENASILHDVELAGIFTRAATNLSMASVRVGKTEFVALASAALHALSSIAPFSTPYLGQTKLLADLTSAHMSLSPLDITKASAESMSLFRNSGHLLPAYLKYKLVVIAMFLNVLQGKDFMAVRFSNFVRNEDPPSHLARWHANVWLIYLLCKLRVKDLQQLGLDIKFVRKHFKTHGVFEGVIMQILDLIATLSVAKSDDWPHIVSRALPELEATLNALGSDVIATTFDYPAFFRSLVGEVSFIALHRIGREF